MKYFRFIMAPPARKRLGQSPKFFYKKTLSFRSRKIPTDKTQQKGAGPRFFATTRRCAIAGAFAFSENQKLPVKK
ncbi:hypothetical protein LEP1GSC121_3431 [Leptospira borgpetersenii serovar Castellonis str. 200801910]|uniref:hypothetical protein n=1 Tax=Leptospira borgpetersenii TaxID=174 RepID=UPI000297D8BF|nr:hypothetical protein [Leptospira borgpetersenii]EKQ98590.1 hypothetical protein LEP1GSC121_3431 [Leptospira borgpetersenii serovar Castellonis str. 200801910]